MLTTSFHHATIGCSMANGSILTYDSTSQPLVPALVDATDLLQGYRYKVPKIISFPSLDAAARCNVESMYSYIGQFNIGEIQENNDD